MKNYLEPHMTQELREISTQALAYAGDAVFELMVRTYLCGQGMYDTNKLHSMSVSFVSAKAQAVAGNKILSMLSDEEIAVYKRGRNAHTRPSPANTTDKEYQTATGLETLFGYLYLSGNTGRLNELFNIIIDNK